jgi:hypothetical protein
MRLGRGAVLVPFGLVLFLVAGCAALLGLDDIERDACLATSCEDGALTDGARIAPDGAPLGDGSSDPDGGSLVLPDGAGSDADGSGGVTLCTDLAMWIAFEGSDVVKPSGVGATGVGSAGAPSYVAGKFGQGSAIGKAGTPEYFAWDPPFSWDVGGTISLWISADYGTNCGGADRMIVWSEHGSRGPQFRCTFADTSFKLITPDASGFNTVNVSGWTNGTFQHVAVTWVKNGTSRLYLQGTEVATLPINITWLQGKLMLGHGAAPPDAVYDDVAVWKRPLSAGEINTVRNAGMTVGQICNVQ